MNNFLSTENGAVLLHPKGFPINLNSQISNILKENDVSNFLSKLN